MYKQFCLLLLLPILSSIGILYFKYKLLFTIITILLSIFIYIVFRNTKLVYKSIEDIINLIKSKYSLKSIDIGEFKKLTAYGVISFNSEIYHIKDLGILSILTSNLGFMQLFTLQIVPFEKDLPLLTVDIMYMFNKRIFFIEIYDLMLDNKNAEYKSFLNQVEEVKKNFSEFENFKVKENWYTQLLSGLLSKKYTIKDEQKFVELLNKIITMFIEYSIKEKKIENLEKKVALVEGFGNKLVDKSGISTDMFKRLFGVDRTRKYLGNVLFGYYTFKEIAKLK